MAIALLTDFGSADHFVGAMKGAILKVDPMAVIVDITHEIPRHDIGAASFILASCYQDFPAGTIFVTVVDPGVGSDRRAIAVAAHERIFVAPDNGVLSRILTTAEKFLAVEIANQHYLGPRHSSTFHGRDIFAPAAAHISLGVLLSDLGPEINDPSIFDVSEPRRISEDKLVAHIVHIDRFGNLITDLTSEDILPNFHVSIGGEEITDLKRTYAEAVPGELFLIEGSTGFIEISLPNASAAKKLNAETGQIFEVTRESR